jgi:hypothetical protein
MDDGQKLPAGHGRHPVASDDAPSFGLYVPAGHAVMFSPLHHAPGGHALTMTAAFWMVKFWMVMFLGARAAWNWGRPMSGETPEISATTSRALAVGEETALMDAITSSRLGVF